MSFPHGIFYVYMEHSGDQYLVAFPSRSTADQVWRTIQETNYTEEETRRHTPQYWSVALLPREMCGTHSGSFGCFIQRISPGGPDGGRISIAPPDHSPDNVNGESFFIRSAVRPQLYWYSNPSSHRLELSSARQTKFCIKRRSPLPFNCSPKEDILIGTDDVHIYVRQNAGDDRDETQKQMVMRYSYAKKNLTVEAATPTNREDGTFRFALFDGGFGAQYSAEQNKGRVGFIYITSQPDVGERWEFVA